MREQPRYIYKPNSTSLKPLYLILSICGINISTSPATQIIL